VLCERGIRTFETATRNTLDLSAIPVLRDRTELPIIVDPSHAAGQSSWVPALSVAAVAAGADGLLIECHPNAERALCDAAQAVTPQVLAAIIRATELLVASARPWSTGTIDECRTAIDGVDSALGRLLERRVTLVASIERLKSERGMPIRDRDREADVVARVARIAPQLGRDGAIAVMNAVIGACLATVAVEA
jgi:chorismate mutase